MKLYLLSTKGLGSYYVLANDPSSAEKTLDAVLDGNDYGFFMERDVTEIKVIADSYVEKDGRISLDNRRNGVIIVGMDVAEKIANAMRPPSPSASIAAKEDVCESDIPESHKLETDKEAMSDLDAGNILHDLDKYAEVRVCLHGYALGVYTSIELIFDCNGKVKPLLRTCDFTMETITYYGKEVSLDEQSGLPYVTGSMYWLMKAYNGPQKGYDDVIQMIKEGRISGHENELQQGQL